MLYLVRDSGLFPLHPSTSSGRNNSSFPAVRGKAYPGQSQRERNSGPGYRYNTGAALQKNHGDSAVYPRNSVLS